MAEDYRHNLLDELEKNKDFLPPYSGDPLGWCDSKLFFYKLYNISLENCDERLNLLRKRSIEIIKNNIINNTTDNINKLTHKIWLTFQIPSFSAYFHELYFHNHMESSFSHITPA